MPCGGKRADRRTIKCPGTVIASRVAVSPPISPSRIPDCLCHHHVDGLGEARQREARPSSGADVVKAHDRQVARNVQAKLAARDLKRAIAMWVVGAEDRIRPLGWLQISPSRPRRLGTCSCRPHAMRPTADSAAATSCNPPPAPGWSTSSQARNVTEAAMAAGGEELRDPARSGDVVARDARHRVDGAGAVEEDDRNARDGAFIGHRRGQAGRAEDKGLDLKLEHLFEDGVRRMGVNSE